jgi:hypothetical protein
MYQKIPDDIRPSERLEKVTYANAFDVDFCLLLRERRSTTLDDMQDSDLEVESNIIESKQLKKRSNKGNLKEEYKSSSSNTKNKKFSLEEMARKMEEMSSEFSKLRLEKQKWNTPQEGNQNKNQYRRPYNPQIMQRDKKNNDDQKI